MSAVTLFGLAAGAQPAMAAATNNSVAVYNFDGARSGAVPDLTGLGHTLHLISSGGGTVRAIAHGPGLGLQFPAKCSGAKCPRAVLRAASTPDLNPGTRTIRWGASVRLPADQTTKGQNVVQKGYSKTSSQYKLQIDGFGGRPSCVLVDVTKRSIKLVRSSVSVADGRWHTVQCVRDGIAFRVVVDGTVRGLMQVPASLSVTNNWPLTVGGKGVYADNDQFNGTLDDVFVRIG